MKIPNQGFPHADSLLLTINGGSSSIKFAVFDNNSLDRVLFGKIDRIGQSDSRFEFHNLREHDEDSRMVEATNYDSATQFLIQFLANQIGLQSFVAVGHRLVHGMQHTQPQLITQKLIEDLRQISPCAPHHLPGEISLIEAFRESLSTLPQFACFDTSFHSTMPRVAKLLALPRRFDRKGIQRYGFHGLSYTFLMQELARVGDTAATHGCVILAHLGNGASMCAVRDGKSMDTSMGFTPAAGLPMGTRSGDIDPGIVSYLARTEKLSISEFEQIANHESGLLGVSEVSSDVRDLIARETEDSRAAEAIELFCYQAKKCIGAYIAALGGLQTLVFTGGIGQNSPSIRHRICKGLGYFGIEIENGRNVENAGVVSSEQSAVKVRVIPTDEEKMIALFVKQLMKAKHV